MGRSPCCDKVGLKKGPWTPEEDQKLLAYIEEHGHGSWRALPAKAGLQRCGKSCRLRWTNYLRPDIKRGKFTLQEEQTIIQLHALLGNRFILNAATLDFEFLFFLYSVEIFYKLEWMTRNSGHSPTIIAELIACTGSAVLLPLKNLQTQQIQAEVLVCGGAPKGSYISAQNGNFLAALTTCGRIGITDPNPQWTMENMPLARTMGDMLILPNGNVLIISGAATGTAGWELGRDPVLKPVIYRPDNPFSSRFEIQNPSTIPRMYHSTATLLRDGRVLIGGSNPHIYYNFTGVLFPTELSLEAFSPSYLDPESEYLRPQIISPASQYTIGYGQRVPVRFKVSGRVNRNLVTVTMVAPGFNTHSFTQNQRLLVLASENVKLLGEKAYQINVVTPNSATLAPPGYYLLFVVHQDIPSEGIWVKIQ